MKKVIVKKHIKNKISSFFPWIYKNEISKLPRNIEPGDSVFIYTSNGELLGTGYINPHSVISIRIYSFFQKNVLDKNLLKSRILQTLKKRKGLETYTNSYRLIHSEGDFLPGLIVDYYNGYLSVQINTAGMERLRKEIIELLVEILNPKGIYEKSDAKAREKEGLDAAEGVLYGEIPDEIIIEENNLNFSINLRESQKTGFYLDQRKNRKLVSSYVKEGFYVLDLFSNTGGFGIYALKAGASFVKFVDISQNAVNKIERNCLLNSLENFEVVKADAFDFLKEEIKNKKMYDLIIVDPPSFAKTKKEKEGALRGFKYLILNGLKLLKENGYLAVFSCSHHVDMDDLKNVSLEASKDTKTPIEVLEHMYQDIDHPYILNIPNSLYLKGLLIRKLAF